MIYFVEHGPGGPVKVGCSSNARYRFKEIQSCSPVQCRLLLLVDGDRRDEQALHRLLVGQWIRGEWFKRGRPMKRLLALGEAGIGRYLAEQRLTRHGGFAIAKRMARDERVRASSWRARKKGRAA